MIIIIMIISDMIMTNIGARCSSFVEYLPMVQCVVGLIPHGGLTELFLIPASGPGLI